MSSYEGNRMLLSTECDRNSVLDFHLFCVAVFNTQINYNDTNQAIYFLYLNMDTCFNYKNPSFRSE